MTLQLQFEVPPVMGRHGLREKSHILLVGKAFLRVKVMEVDEGGGWPGNPDDCQNGLRLPAIHIRRSSFPARIPTTGELSWHLLSDT